MSKSKVTLIKPKKENKKESLEILPSLIMVIVGLILLTNSSKAVIIVCYCLGAFIMLFGVYQLISYYRLKKELNIENTTSLILGISTIFVGLVITILASAIETFLRFIIGIILIVNGIQKIILSINLRNYIELLLGIILVAMGLYTILAENIVFALVGALLIISSIIDIIKYFKTKK